MRTASIGARAVSALALALAACSTDEPQTVITTPRIAGTVADESAVVNAVMFAATDPFDPTTVAAFAPTNPMVGPAAWAGAAVDASAAYYRPSGCVKASVNGSTANYVLDGCDGPLGVTRMTGAISVVYSSDPGGAGVAVTSTSLQANGLVANVNETGRYTETGSTRQVEISDGSTAVAAGNTFSAVRTGTLVWTKGSDCAAWNSTGLMQINEVGGTSQAFAQTLCNEQCPTGTMVLRDGLNQTLTLTFSGTPDPTYADSAGLTGTVRINCGTR
jgi:hypothetical protein